jgi:prepilin-type N-terminal cleavage/methylation domain-containing protein
MFFHIKNSFKNFKNKNTTGGFTLTELLISIAIFVLLASAMVVQYGTTDAAAQLNRAQDQVVSTIKDARKRSVAIVEYGGDDTGIFPSYGVAFKDDSREMILYADCEVDDDGNGTVNNGDDFTYDPESSDCAAGNANGLVETVTLSRDTHIQKIETFGGVAQTPDDLYIEYIRPLPRLWVTTSSNDVLPYGRAEITIAADRSEGTRMVTIYTSGLIETNTPS